MISFAEAESMQSAEALADSLSKCCWRQAEVKVGSERRARANVGLQSCSMVGRWCCSSAERLVGKRAWERVTGRRTKGEASERVAGCGWAGEDVDESKCREGRREQERIDSRVDSLLPACACKVAARVRRTR